VHYLVTAFASIAAGAIMTAWLVPWTGGIAAVLCYLGVIPNLAQGPIVTGILYSVAAWAVMSIVAAPLTTSRSANSRLHGEVENQFEELSAQVVRLKEQANEKADHAAMAACKEASTNLQAVRLHLDRIGPQWVLGYGYLTAWTHIHQIEQIVLAAEQKDEILGIARYQDLELDNSAIPDKQKTKLSAQLAKVCSPSDGSDKPPIAEMRTIVQTVRSAIDEFRDASYSGLLQVRNRTVVVLLLTELFTFMLLAASIALKVTPAQIAAGVLIFLTGAVIGLFNRLVQPPDNSDISDYGLSLARLRTLPLYSGLAAVSGVILYTLLASGFTMVNTTDVSSNAATKFADAFNLQTHPTSLLIAAVFGFAPNLLTARLQKLADDYKNNIKSTSATDGSSATSGSPATAGH
jgi:hypothetical protein